MGLSDLDQTIHTFPRQKTPTMYGRIRGKSIFDIPCCRTESGSIHTKSGAQRHFVPLPGSAVETRRNRISIYWCQKAATSAGVLTKSEVQQLLIRLSGDTKLVVGRQPHSYASMRPKARSCVTASSVRWPRHSSLACSHTSG